MDFFRIEVFNGENFQCDSDFATFWREFNTIWKEAKDELSVVSLICVKLIEIEAVEWRFEDWSNYADFFLFCLKFEIFYARFYQINTIEIFIDHRKCVVLMLSLVAQQG